MMLCDLKTQDVLTEQQVKDAVEKTNEWHGTSMDYPGGITYDYRISKGVKGYTTEVVEITGIGMRETAPDFGRAFSLLESLQNHIERYRNLGKTVVVEPIMRDAKTNVEMDCSKIQTHVLTHDVWEGFIEWKGGVKSTIALTRDDKTGYTLVVNFGTMNLTAKCVARLNDAFSLLRDFNERIRNLVR